jgi:hypothetical protein
MRVSCEKHLHVCETHSQELVEKPCELWFVLQKLLENHLEI